MNTMQWIEEIDEEDGTVQHVLRLDDSGEFCITVAWLEIGCYIAYNSHVMTWATHYAPEDFPSKLKSTNLEDAKKEAIHHTLSLLNYEISGFRSKLREMENLRSLILLHNGHEPQTIRFQPGDFVSFWDGDKEVNAIILESFPNSEPEESIPWIHYIISWSPGVDDFMGVSDWDLRPCDPPEAIKDMLHGLYFSYQARMERD